MNEHIHGDEEREASRLPQIIVAGVLFLVSLLFLKGTLQLIVYIAAYFVAGFSVWKEAIEGIMHGEWFDENFLMAIASGGAFFIQEYPEAVTVMLLYQIGEGLQDKAVDSSRASIQALVNIRPDRANLVTENGVTEVAAEQVAVGEMILVRPGERIPLDGTVKEGTSFLDTSALTGESLPREVKAGDAALAGCVNQNGMLKILVTKSFGESSASRILELVENARENKATQEQFITRFAKIYTPIVVGCAVILAVLPPLLGLGSFSHFVHKALAFLVISCPCALVISVPLSFFSGIGYASHRGILMKGGNYLEMLAKADVAAFDKTGTLTEGRFTVRSITPADGIEKDMLLELAAYCESQSTHPLAKAICDAYGKEISDSRIAELSEQSGYGIRAKIDGIPVLAGKAALLEQNRIAVPEMDSAETTVYVAQNGQYIGCIALGDALKTDAKVAMQELRALGVKHLTMLSGDRQQIATQIGGEIGLDRAFGELLPEDKVNRVVALKKESTGTLLYAGDGINDAPVLAAADVGIAMGGLGSDAAMEAADVVIMSDEPSKIALAIRIARNTLKIARENIAFSLAVKLIILTVSVLFDMGLWIAVFADVGVCMLAILNTLRVRCVK
jgi:Cd2+/Zn2+-exporting ATPase